MNICSSNRSLPQIEKQIHHQFFLRLNVQKENLLNFSINALADNKFQIEILPFEIQNLFSKAFGSGNVPQYKDIQKLSERIIKKISNTSGPKKNWNSEEIIVMFWVSKFFQKTFQKEIQSFTLQNWETISDFVPGRNGRQCMFKYLKTRKVPLSQCPWNKYQQILLQKLVEKFSSQDWNLISEELYFASSNKQIYRLPKQCREHWSSYSNSQIKKGPWNTEQDVILLSNILNKGRRWSQIRKYLPGRTQNAIKNRANLLLNKDLKKIKAFADNQQVVQLIEAIKKHHDSSTIFVIQSAKQQQKKQNNKSEIRVNSNLKYKHANNIVSLSSFDHLEDYKESFVDFSTINSLGQIVHAAYNPIKQQQKILQQNKNLQFEKNLHSPYAILDIPKNKVDHSFSKMSQNYWDFEQMISSSQHQRYDDLQFFCQQ